MKSSHRFAARPPELICLALAALQLVAASARYPRAFLACQPSRRPPENGIILSQKVDHFSGGTPPEETNSNFGFNLPWWDRLLGTYKAQPKAGHEGMTIGIEQFRTGRDLWLDRMLVQPIKGPASGYPINRETGKKS